MSDAPTLFELNGEPTALARATDPATSHQAAASVSPGLRDSQEAVLAVLARYGPMCDVDLVDRYEVTADRYGKRQSPSGIRSRRHELVAAGRVVDTGQRVKLESGRHAIVWAAA